MSDTLENFALTARAKSYAPYSRYQVGAAVLANEQVYLGANVENASYGLSLCAERNAIVTAVLDGARTVDAVAVATQSSPPAPPCGMCLQTRAEFAADATKLRVILVNPAGERREFTLAELLPHGFVPADLGSQQHTP